MTRAPKATNLFSAFASKRKAQGFSPMERPQQGGPELTQKQHASLMKAKLSTIHEEDPLPPKHEPSLPPPLPIADSAPETKVSSPHAPEPTTDEPTTDELEPVAEPKSDLLVITPHSQRQQTNRTSWSAEADYIYVRTLAQHTTCDDTNGLYLDHPYVDQVAIQLVEDSLSHNVDISVIVKECQSRFPNKSEIHYSAQSIEVLLELNKNCPGFSLQQLNQKHLNMWTRAIVPFRQVFETGMLYKSKPLFHNDCKRFVKVFINFFVFVVQNGVDADYCPTLIKSAGQASKLLQQWAVAMFERHGTNMSRFMFQCGLRLCRTYIRAKQTVYPTASEHAILTMPSPSASDILVVLKSYFGYICEYEGVTPAAKFEMDSRNMRSTNPLVARTPVDPRYVQQAAPRANPCAEMYPPSQAAYPPPAAHPHPSAYAQPAGYARQAPVLAPYPYSSEHPYTAAHPPSTPSYSRPTGHWQGGIPPRPALPHQITAQHPRNVPRQDYMPAYYPPEGWQQPAPAHQSHGHPYHPANSTYSHPYSHATAGRHGGYGHPPPRPLANSPPMHARQPAGYERWLQTPELSFPVPPPLPLSHSCQPERPEYPYGVVSTLSPAKEAVRERNEDGNTVQSAQPTPTLEAKPSSKGQAVDDLLHEVLKHIDADSSSTQDLKAEPLKETQAVSEDRNQSNCMRILPPSSPHSEHSSPRSILN